MHTLLAYISAHPYAALLIVFLTAFLESVAIIGTAVPAGIVMFTAGTLIGTDTLDLWVTLLIAALGAVAGDSLSYELGHTYSDQIKSWRIFKRHAATFSRGEQFVQRHGGKSILFARFLAPVRAVVPLVAGIAGMQRTKFYLVNIISALAWSPAHILPGVIFGASIRVAEAVSARLALVLLLVATLLWCVVWVVRTGTRFGLPKIKRWRDQAVQWLSQRHTKLARLLHFFLDPQRPESQIILVSALLVLGSGWLFFGVLEDIVTGDPLIQADIAIFHFLQALRISEVDRLMLGITEMGDVGILTPVALLVLGWLLARHCWHTAAYWLAAAGFSQLLVQLLKFTLGRHRPIGLYTDSAIAQFSFPSGHATSSMVIYGFLAFLLSRQQTQQVRIAILATAAVCIALIGFSRLYLGAHWFSDVLGGFSLGLAWVALLALAYTHFQVKEALQPARLSALVAAALLLFGPLYIARHFPTDLIRYTSATTAQVISLTQWTSTAWQQLPLQRTEIGGDMEEALPLQWADSASGITRRLARAGWQAAPDWSMQAALLWLTSDAVVKDLPVLPKFNRGNRSELAFIYSDPKQALARTVLRLWRSDFLLENPATGTRQPIWYGGLYSEEFKRPWHLVPIGMTKNITLTPPTFAQWPTEVRWIARIQAQNGLARQAFLIPPQEATISLAPTGMEAPETAGP